MTQPIEAPFVERVLRPFQEFAHRESSSGLLLLGCTVVALAWANSPWAEVHADIWEISLIIGLGDVAIEQSLHHWINDGLMAVFFFVVGLEIKREVLVGELASRRTAMLPLAAAAGGMAVPALLYTAFNASGPGSPGWGIPMATDIAFALGVLALLGPRVPLAVKVFLTALAIVDDIGAVLVIALFYTADLWVGALLAGGLVFTMLLGCNAAGVRHPAPYALLGLLLWLAFLQSGVHATVAGVVLAFTIPARTRIDAAEFLARTRGALDEFASAGVHGTNVVTSRAHQEAILAVETAAEMVQAPLQKLEDKLHGLVAFGIMPLFALANAGVPLAGGTQAILSPVALGVVVGLVLGKPLGITVLAWLATRARVAELPASATWPMIHGAGWLGGIGFTMSLFIAGLAFDEGPLLTQAKLGILLASFIAGTVGWALLRSQPPAPKR
ncbi:MAG TPA: Na+/H+ antiporter NhaA [Gemmatimonadales bacterium]|nr:Na+/H+ antiporter NhaA [Gemmatimonadales bacterium]